MVACDYHPSYEKAISRRILVQDWLWAKNLRLYVKNNLKKQMS
jgi:hypothetical protein